MTYESELQLEKDLCTVLAKVYRLIPWSKISTKSAYKYYLSNIKASCNVNGFKPFLDKLCTKIGVEFIKIDSELINNLDNDARTMHLLREESMFVMNYALEIVEELKKERSE